MLGEYIQFLPRFKKIPLLSYGIGSITFIEFMRVLFVIFLFFFTSVFPLI